MKSRKTLIVTAVEMGLVEQIAYPSTMRDRELYGRILGLEAPWRVKEVELDVDREEVFVVVEHDENVPLRCPCCAAEVSGYDTRRRRWRHLDTCQYKTILVAEVPRVECPHHGVRQIEVPWAEAGSRFTALFECLAIDWLKEASVSAVARRLHLSWDEAEGILSRAVQRGLSRRPHHAPTRIGIDETSFAKRHEYVTVVTDQDTSAVLYVGDDRTTKTLERYYESLRESELSQLEVVSMDMWQPYIKATQKYVPDAEAKIAFDKFHVAQHLGNAVDRVRRQEHRELKHAGDDCLKGTKYLWLMHPSTMSVSTWHDRFEQLRNSALRTARAWALKETAMGLWEYVTRGWARRAWKHWLAWAQRCRLEPIRRAARMIRKHLEGIITAIVKKATNAGAESTNAQIQRIKRMACGYRNRGRFRHAIYFHLGGLDLYPNRFTHTKP